MSSEENVINISDFRGRKAQLVRERGNVVIAQFRRTVPQTCTIHVLRDMSSAGPDQE